MVLGSLRTLAQDVLEPPRDCELHKGEQHKNPGQPPRPVLPKRLQLSSSDSLLLRAPAGRAVILSVYSQERGQQGSCSVTQGPSREGGSTRRGPGEVSKLSVNGAGKFPALVGGGRGGRGSDPSVRAPSFLLRALQRPRRFCKLHLESRGEGKMSIPESRPYPSGSCAARTARMDGWKKGLTGPRRG